MTERPIHVAIPTYNNASALRRILPQLIAQDFASITVLDDASTDETPTAVAEFPSVTYIRAGKNGGPVAARNLLLGQISDGFILFLDSDMELCERDVPQRLSDFARNHPNLGCGAGAVRGADGEILRYSRGYDFQPLCSLLGNIFHCLFRASASAPLVQRAICAIAKPFTLEVYPEQTMKVDWVRESVFFIRADLFEAFGGFDRSYIRFHEGPDLCLRLRKAGYEVWFYPSISAVDHDQHTGSSWYRTYHLFRSFMIYYYKHPSRLILYRYPHP